MEPRPISDYPRPEPQAPAQKKLHLGWLAGITVFSFVAGLFLKFEFDGTWWEFAGFVTGFVNVYLVAVEHIINWPIGIVNLLLYGWVFFTSRLYADMTLQFFFLALGIQGWINWAKGGTGKTALFITKIKPISWGLIVLLQVAGTAVYVPIVTYYKGASPFIDSALTVASIIAQFLLNWKKIENWVLWIIVDAIYVPLYISRHLISTAILYGLFFCLAVSGLVSWIRIYRREREPLLFSAQPQ
ncbi:MAG TPA: nicotinamide riboside transporter PnuC [Fimbriimonas sp.]|nr:nicotinamide riboside transporter PnuC [Fimbriimonas sp.]